MIIGIKFELNKALYIRDPQDTDLGKRILENSILLINKIGFDTFTFKKLANEIGSAEKSIYRYFDNKHLLLLFLTSWYWEWVHYLIIINTKNCKDPKEALNIAIQNIVFATSENSMTEYINENILHRVVINEGAKAYHTFKVDDENKSGMFLSYKLLVETVTHLILGVNPDFDYPRSLSSTLFEMANNQIYFAEHLPRMTDLIHENQCEEELIKMMKLFTKKLLA